MIERVDLDCVPEQHLKSNWPHDAGILLIYVLFLLAASPADNELMHGTYYHTITFSNFKYDKHLVKTMENTLHISRANKLEPIGSLEYLHPDRK